MKKRILAVLLLMGLMLLPLPTARFGLTAYAARVYIDSADNAKGSDYTDNAALAAKLDEIFHGKTGLYTGSNFATQKLAPLGSSDMTSKNTFYLKGIDTGLVMYGTTCYIYANSVYNTLFHEWVRHADDLRLSNVVISGGGQAFSYQQLKQAGVKCGAYIRTTSDSSGAFSNSGAHSMILLSYDAERITVLEGNADGYGLVRITTREWDDFNYTNLTKKNRYIAHVVQPTAAQYAKLYGTDNALKITQQPVSASGAVNSNISFTVKADGAKLSYQWYYKKSGESKFTAWNKKTAATVSMPVYASWHKAQFYCVVKDGSGKTVQSDTVTLSVTSKITQQPVSVSGAVGDTVKFTAAATGNGISYQWYVKKANESAFTAWNKKTAASVSTPVYNSWHKAQFYCVVKDSSGKTLRTNTVTLTVVPKITQQPAGAFGAVNDTVKFTVKATGNGLTYQWYYKKSGESAFTLWNKRTAATASTVVYKSWNGAQFYCVVKDANGSSVKTNTVTLTVK